MNKKKQISIDRKNRIRTKRFQEASKRNRERKGMMLELNKLEEEERNSE